MERVTQKDEFGYYLTGDGIYSDWGMPEKFRGDDVDRLAAYEDTGLEPKKIMWLKEMMDAAFAEDTSKIDRLRELDQADREGRCVVLPCKVGSTVYMPFCGEAVEKRIGQFHVNGYTCPRIWADIDCDWATTQRYRWDLAFGKTVFLTHADAEAALRR